MSSRKQDRPEIFDVRLSRRTLLSGSASLAALGLAGAPMSLTITPALAEDGPVVATRSGKVQGLRIAGTDQFRGIRYGATTAGAGRFVPARPVEPWSGVQPAVTYGPSAPQVFSKRPAHIAWYYTDGPGGEDCLVLNVFTPQANTSAKRPVMIWIHGGGFAIGAGDAKGFDGTNLARNGDVVVVSLNHRLNIFGHLYLGSIGGERYADSGNLGSLDIVAALRWVRDNIENFGGDPGNVTIFGQSGGASYIATLLAMPDAKGLFHKAIIESFSAGLKMGRPETAQKAGEIVLKHLEISPDNLAPLADVPVDRVLAAMNATIKDVGVDNFRAIVDGRSLPRDPFSPDAPEVSAEVPLIIGNVEHEATYALSVNPKNYEMTRDDAVKRTAGFVGIDAAQAETLFKSFEARHPGRPVDTYIAIQSLQMYRRNDVKAAELKAAQGRAPVYMYLWSWKTPVLPDKLFAMHTLEVPFVFGNTDELPEIVGTGPEQKPLSEKIQGAWVNFARSGNPNHAKLPPWKPFTTAARDTMVFDTETRLVANPLGEDLKEISQYPFYDPEARRG
jgi:para-nitrobenzyl esterase